MTTKDIINQQHEVERFLTERRLTFKEQREAIYYNLAAERQEAIVAHKEGDYDHEMGEICDLIVFALGCVPPSENLEYIPLKRRISYADIDAAVAPFADAKNDYDYAAFSNDLINICYSYIYQCGYDPVLCMDETIAKINSRHGGWDAVARKWIKDPHQDPTTLYAPDYAACKLREPSII